MDNIIAQRGTKRKRYEPPQQDVGVKIEGKLHHNLKEVKKAAKKAKIFETQKLIKKLKDLRKKTENSNEITETEAQLEALKALNLESIAMTVLKTKLNKLRMLRENVYLQAAASKELVSNIDPAPPGTPAAKIQSRLLSSKILAAEVATVVEDLKNVIQLETKPIDASPEEAGAILEPPKKLTRTAVSKAKDKGPSNTLKSSRSNIEVGGRELGGNALDDVAWESGTVTDEIEVDDGWESGSVAEDNVADLVEEYDGNREGLEVIPANLIKPPSKDLSSKTLPVKVSAKLSGLQSTFLPSLSVGFVRGTSDDSDLSESEAKFADIDIKKNRRGQRARQAIWEKKYGRNANHKKKKLEDYKDNPDHSIGHQASFSKAPSRKMINPKPMPQYLQDVDAGWSQRGTHTAVAEQKRDSTLVSRKEIGTEKPLHPSWEAKRKLKEKESAGIVPSQGKKIKFQ